MGVDRKTMKNGIAKSYALKKIQLIVAETLADAYAQLRALSPHTIRKDDLQRDIDYVKRRSSAEGLEFFTVQLPNLGDWFDDWLYGGRLERVEGFKPYDGFFPVFMRPFWIYFDGVVKPSLNNPEESFEFSADQALLVRLARTVMLGLKKLYAATTEGNK